MEPGHLLPALHRLFLLHLLPDLGHRGGACAQAQLPDQVAVATSSCPEVPRSYSGDGRHIWRGAVLQVLVKISPLGQKILPHAARAERRACLVLFCFKKSQHLKIVYICIYPHTSINLKYAQFCFNNKVSVHGFVLVYRRLKKYKDKKKYLYVLFDIRKYLGYKSTSRSLLQNPAYTNQNISSNLLWAQILCIFLKQQSQCEWISFTGSTELMSSFTLTLVISFFYICTIKVKTGTACFDKVSICSFHFAIYTTYIWSVYYL